MYQGGKNKFISNYFIRLQDLLNSSRSRAEYIRPWRFQNFIEYLLLDNVGLNFVTNYKPHMVRVVTCLIIHMKKLLDSDWLKTVQV